MGRKVCTSDGARKETDFVFKPVDEEGRVEDGRGLESGEEKKKVLVRYLN